MKKTIALLLIAGIGLTANAQKKDSTTYANNPINPEVLKQSVVYIFEKTDTVKVETLLYKAKGHNVKYSTPGWIIRKGRAAMSKDGWKWIEEPKKVGALTNSKRKVIPI